MATKEARTVGGAFRLSGAQYRWWREELCGTVYGAEAPPRVHGLFDNTIRIVPLEAGLLSTVENHGDDYSMARTRRSITAINAPKYWLLGVCLRGQEVATVGGVEEVMEVGDIRLFHSDLEMASTTKKGAHIGMLAVPDGMAKVLCPSSSGWAPGVLPSRGGLGRVLSTYLMSVFEQLRILREEDLHALVPSILPLLDAVVAPSRHSVEGARVTVRATQRQRILAFVETHLGDPRLSPGWIAASFGISTRYVHALFANSHLSIGETIVTRRLTRCREDLIDPRFHDLTITEIAFRWGFSDPSHFSHAFRRRFGMAPRDARRVS